MTIHRSSEIKDNERKANHCIKEDKSRRSKNSQPPAVGLPELFRRQTNTTMGAQVTVPENKAIPVMKKSISRFGNSTFEKIAVYVS